MNSDQPNPYAATEPLLEDATSVNRGDFDAPTLKKIDAIIKDAGQFWIAIALCFLCTALGLVVIGPWYLVRLLQWNSLARTYPKLLESNVPRNSLAKSFQSAKTKLIIGICFGVLILLLCVVAYLSLPFITTLSGVGIE